MVGVLVYDVVPVGRRRTASNIPHQLLAKCRANKVQWIKCICYEFQKGSHTIGSWDELMWDVGKWSFKCFKLPKMVYQIFILKISISKKIIDLSDKDILRSILESKPHHVTTLRLQRNPTSLIIRLMRAALNIFNFKFFVYNIAFPPTQYITISISSVSGVFMYTKSLISKPFFCFFCFLILSLFI